MPPISAPPSINQQPKMIDSRYQTGTYDMPQAQQYPPFPPPQPRDRKFDHTHAKSHIFTSLAEFSSKKLITSLPARAKSTITRL